MARVIFTPWKNQGELLAVRDQFYPPPFYDGPDMRSYACAKVSCWKTRGNLPHPIEATALLTDAILHDDAGKNSVFAIRATYSAAFCRFVTVLVDRKLDGQRKTMFQRAVDLGLPASFVELRHEATHRELPSLIVLRNATQRSLEWLWGYYWGRVDPHAAAVISPALGSESGALEGNDDILPLRESIRGTLGTLLGDAENGAPPRKKRKALEHQNQTATASQLVSICKASKKGASVLSRVLLEDGLLAPAGRGLGDPLDHTFIKWEHLLQMVTESHPAFLSILTEEMANDLAFTSPSPSEAQASDPKSNNQKNAYCEAVYMWLDIILRSTQWKLRRRLLSFSYLLAVCEESANPWTDALRGILIKKEGKRSKGGFTKVRSQGHAAVLDSGTSAEDDATKLQKFGWGSLDVWDSRPLGVV